MTLNSDATNGGGEGFVHGRTVGIDVGGTKMLGIAVDTEGNIVAEERRPSPHGADSDSALIEEMAQLATALGPYDHVGVGVPGLVNLDGVLRASPHIEHVADLDVAGRLGERLGHSVQVDNDATCAAVIEWFYGAGRGTSDMVMLTLGTGIGGGLVLNGTVQRGADGFTGEYGHMLIDPNGPPCACGQRGCWERYASGTGLAYLARQAMADGRLSRVLELAGGELDAVRGEMVQQAAEEGDSDALAVVDDFGRWVATGMAGLANALDPEVFVIGGGLAAGADLYLPPIQKWFPELLYQSDLRRIADIRFATFGQRAGAAGASQLFRIHD